MTPETIFLCVLLVAYLAAREGLHSWLNRPRQTRPCQRPRKR